MVDEYWLRMGGDNVTWQECTDGGIPGLGQRCRQSGQRHPKQHRPEKDGREMYEGRNPADHPWGNPAPIAVTMSIVRVLMQLPLPCGVTHERSTISHGPHHHRWMTPICAPNVCPGDHFRQVGYPSRQSLWSVFIAGTEIERSRKRIKMQIHSGNYALQI